MIELAVGDLEVVIDSYAEFCAFRSAKEERRNNQELNTHVSREEWLADQRAFLHKRMRKRRRSRGGF